MVCILRRLAAKCAGLHAQSIVSDILAAWQFGFGVSRGVLVCLVGLRLQCMMLHLLSQPQGRPSNHERGL